MWHSYFFSAASLRGHHNKSSAPISPFLSILLSHNNPLHILLHYIHEPPMTMSKLSQIHIQLGLLTSCKCHRLQTTHDSRSPLHSCCYASVTNNPSSAMPAENQSFDIPYIINYGAFTTDNVLKFNQL